MKIARLCNECNLAEITWNKTVWGMPTNNVKGVYSGTVSAKLF